MSLHPLLVAVLVVDGFALLLVAVAVPTAIRVLLHWAPSDSSRAQLRLERSAEGAAIAGRAGAAALFTSSLLLVVAIAWVLPHIVPGAMCGTGVLQAMGGRGERALALRLVALGMLSAWQLCERLDRGHPRAPLTVTASRLLLAATPLIGLAVVDTARALWALDIEQPVDCCTAVYDRVRPLAAEASGSGGGTVALWLALLGGLGLVLLGGLARGWPARGRRLVPGLLAVGALAWAAAASVALVRVLASYHYGVLYHHCPWCLLLPEHQGVGWLLFGAILLVAHQGLRAWVASRLAGRRSPVRRSALASYRRAGLRVALGVVAFWLVAAVPPVLWRLRYGTWMS